MKRLYLDTSSYLTLLLGEEGWEALRDELSGAEILSSVLLILGAIRNLVRLSREGILPADDFLRCSIRLEADREGFVLRDLDLDLCSGFELPVVTTPRSLDLVHLRTALWFHRQRPLDRFVSTDRSQIRAARELGLPV